MKRFFYFIIILIIVGLAFAYFTKSDKTTSNQSTSTPKAIICDQAYALCSAAKCIPDPARKGYAICSCATYDGVSAGTISCKKRKPYTDKYNVKHVVSTFSFKNIKKPNLVCPTGTPWTNCVNAPCSVDPTDPSKSICSCPIETTGPIFTFGGNCDTSTCSKAFWSGALLSDNNWLGKALADQTNNKTDPTLVMCEKK